MPNAYNYSNLAIQQTLAGSISSGAVSINVSATTGFPSSTPYVLALDYGAATEELVVVTAPPAGTTLTVTRGFGGTSAQSHSVGAIVRHVVNAQDLTDFRTHEAATAAIHGVTGTLVGTSDSQTLANKTLTNPTINAATLTGTVAGAHTYSGALTLSGGATLSSALTSSGASLTGTWAGSPTFTGNPVFQGNVSIDNKLSQTGAAANTLVQGSLVTADTFDRFRRYADGLHEWGPGNATRDTNLYRSTGKTLKTDNSFVAAGLLAAVPTDVALDGLDVNLPSGSVGDLLNLRVNSNIQAAMDASGAFRVYGGNSPQTYTPTWSNTGGATFSTNTGYYWKMGKIVYITIYFVVSNPGSGTNPVSFTTPSNPDRSTRQVMVMSGDNLWVSGIYSTGHALTFVSGSGAVWDRIRASNANADNRDGQLEGGHLLAGGVGVIQGWYREV